MNNLLFIFNKDFVKGMRKHCYIVELNSIVWLEINIYYYFQHIESLSFFLIHGYRRNNIQNAIPLKYVN